MFEAIFLPRNAERYRTAPLSEPRADYLRHLNELGACRTTLRKNANDQLSLVRLLDLREGDLVSILQIEAAAAIWALPNGHRFARAASSKARTLFVSRGIQWLRFLGWLDEPEHRHHSHHSEIVIFQRWLREERGLSTATIQDYCAAANHFLFWLAGKGVPLNAVRMTHIDDVIAAEHRQGVWKRRTMHDYAQRLKAFFLFAEASGWCRTGLAAGIMAPRFMSEETVPKGIKRDDVLRLMASVAKDRPVDKRDRAILMLLIVYGLRAGEIRGLQLDDLDWENGMLRVRCPKPGRTHLWPLSHEVGYAILRYIREARPSGFGRSLFFTAHAPIRPLGRTTLGKMVRDRLAGIGILSGRRGTHVLRHAAAQHLLDQGMSMKVIGDFLGHRDPSSTAIYAKVNLAALREVAAFDLEGLA
ncbi:tyrosine-type recombinase/integrase [Aminobacter aminovorans]|jgi:integrase/recombinase XerD|uniref:Integrase n=1 Tax=Aminobacter aminovorans TaxID=83263 RepID=A0AAC8YV25_AMIAI|nr:tyrosine-type recombinase/integrase [Aminobacter aminovorans]AMS45018.1 integrase [Aminobacter aminovorans]MBB3710432.1 site-specific recombinase XerD [Aminobacter aminovorans]